MNASDLLALRWLAVDPERSRKGAVDPLEDRIHQGAVLWFTRFHTVPNVVVLRSPDYDPTMKEVTVPLPNGTQARLDVQLSPFGGESREMLLGRKEVTD